MDLADYQDRYVGARIVRDVRGVLEVTLHTRGGEARWGHSKQALHAELGELFADIARDRDNKVVILTGTGENFLVAADPDDPPSYGSMAEGWEHGYEEGVALVRNLLAIPVPVIAAVNGPAHLHAELAVMSDIVLAAETASFSDPGHVTCGIVPGDGAQTIWPMLLGPNRGRYFLLSGEIIDAHEARRLGIVGEVLPGGELMPRARHLAARLAANSSRMLRHTRALLVRDLRRRMEDEHGGGLALEALAMLTGRKDAIG